MAPQTRKAAIVGGNRIPFARSNGPYAQASNQDMLTATIDGLVARFDHILFDTAPLAGPNHPR